MSDLGNGVMQVMHWNDRYRPGTEDDGVQSLFSWQDDADHTELLILLTLQVSIKKKGKKSPGERALDRLDKANKQIGKAIRLLQKGKPRKAVHKRLRKARDQVLKGAGVINPRVLAEGN